MVRAKAILATLLACGAVSFAQTGVLFQDTFSTQGPRLNTAAWTTEIGCSSFFGRTQLADWVTPGGVGTFVVGANGAEMALNTYNPTGNPPGKSLFGTHGKTITYYQPTGTNAILFTTRMQLTSLQPGIVYGLYLYAIPAGCPTQTQHDEIDIEVVTNFLQPGKPLTVQLNRYANEPLGVGNGVIANLPAGFDPLAVHDWSIRWSLSSIDYLVDGMVLYSTTTHVPQGSMQVNVDAWGPDATWPDAYSASLQVASSAAQNQRFVANLRSVTVAAVSTTPALNITKTHSGSFSRGQSGATYTLTVANAQNSANTSGTVTVTESLPTGLTLTGISGNGWTCSVATATCTRSDVLASGSNYPPITATVNVAANAPASATNQANVSGGGAAPASAFDPTTITTVSTFPVSGKVTVGGVGLSGVTIDVNGSATLSTTTALDGSYLVALNQGGSYTVSAAASGYSFSSPVTLFNLNTPQTVNFSGTAVAGLQFYPVTPCRLVDTRVSSMPATFGPPSLVAGAIRSFTIPANIQCQIPAIAAAYSLNATVVTKGYLGVLTIWPAGQPMPNASTLNSYLLTSTAVANAAIVPAGANGAISVYASDATDLILDINGYFAPPSTGLVFYPVAPCRLVDTRVITMPANFGPPAMAAGQTRSFIIPQQPVCPIPAQAQAYSLNVTAIPKTTLGFLSIWPTGRTRPNVSTLNVYTPGTVVADAAIVQAGDNGAISAYVTDQTDLVIDIDGYFGPPGNGNGLRFYPVTPCRVADTRIAGFPTGLGTPAMSANSFRSYPVPQGICGVPPNAGGYSLNFTALPHAPQLGVFITWPTGQVQPNVSTMNSYNGTVVSNAAIVPAGINGAISVFVSDLADVLFDINGYFAP